MEKLAEALHGSSVDAKNALDKYANGFTLPTLKEMASDIKDVANLKMFVFLAAYNMKEKGASSIFVSRSAVHLFPDIVNAGRFLLKYELI